MDLLNSKRLCVGHVPLHSQSKHTFLHLQGNCQAFSHMHTKKYMSAKPNVPVSREGGSRGLACTQVSSRGHDDLQTRCPLEHTSLSIYCFSTLILSHFTFILSSFHLSHRSSTSARCIHPKTYQRWLQGKDIGK